MSSWPLICFSYNNTALLQNTCLGVRLPCVLYMCSWPWHHSAGSLGGHSSLHWQLPPQVPTGLMLPWATWYESFLFATLRAFPKQGSMSSVSIFSFFKTEKSRAVDFLGSEQQLKSDGPRFESWLWAYYLHELGHIS